MNNQCDYINDYFEEFENELNKIEGERNYNYDFLDYHNLVQEKENENPKPTGFIFSKIEKYQF